MPLAERAGVAPTRAGWSTLTEEPILELQKNETAIGLRNTTSMRTGGLPLGPTVDGDLIPRSPLKSLRHGIGGDKPFVVGSVDEFSMAAVKAGKVLRWIPRNALLRLAGLTGDRRAAYLSDNADVAERGKILLAGRVLTDAVFRANVLRMLDARGPGPTWAYWFSWPSRKDGLAGHCIDVPFFFDCLDGPALEPLTGGNPPQSIADELHCVAADFITAGKPMVPLRRARQPDPDLRHPVGSQARRLRAGTRPGTPALATPPIPRRRRRASDTAGNVSGTTGRRCKYRDDLEALRGNLAEH